MDLDETARAIDGLINSGIDGILALGTFGECATVTWEEKRAFMATCVEAARGRVPVFGGTTALNTREAIRQTAAAHDLGLDGTMLGPPMWCQVDVPTAVQFYRRRGRSVPRDSSVCRVYANPSAFKFMFPRPFWEQVAQIPQVVSCKYLGIGMLLNDLAVTRGRIKLLIDIDYYGAARMTPEDCNAFWTSCAVNGPASVIRLRDAVAAAKRTGDSSAAKEVGFDARRGSGDSFRMAISTNSRNTILALRKRVLTPTWLDDTAPVVRPITSFRKPILRGQSARAALGPHCTSVRRVEMRTVANAKSNVG